MTKRSSHNRRTTQQPRAAIAAGLLAVSAIMLAGPAPAIELDDVTVVTLARNGSWGVATAGATGEAIAAALRSCRAMSGAPTDCGAQSVATRGGWVVADLCGDHQIIVSGSTRENAETAAFDQQRRVRSLYVPDLPPCRRILTVDPGGAIAAGEARPPAALTADY
jgi:hypothetical protein